MSVEMEKSYTPREVEGRIYEMWERAGAFRAVPDDRPREERFTIVIPPPNITGALHLGHAINNTLQDILIRWHRMMGHNTLWQPGTDHAGIATQAVVEKRIREGEGKSRNDLGREELVRRIWAWKDQYEARILSQLKSLGCSCDWERTRFTLDEGLAHAVRNMFFRLFQDGLVYRGKRLVNWDTHLQTAVADDEVYYETVKSFFWHLRYPFIDAAAGEPTHVHIATTRPETMLGDTAVAVHPDPAGQLDIVERGLREKLSGASPSERPAVEKQLESLAARRETHLPKLIQLAAMAKAGRRIMLPLVDREIPLILDEWAKPELGSGCVKITPAHDPNDYEVGLRHDLPMVNILSPDGTVNENGGPYAGMPFPEARKRVVADLEERGLVESIDDHTVELGHSDRSKSPIEPYLSDQWFVRMDDVEGNKTITLGKGTSNESTAHGLAEAALEAVRDGRVEFYPPRYAKSYLDWLGEKRDWCISRQLWWGHRIPVWTRTGNPAEQDFALLAEQLEELTTEYPHVSASFKVFDTDALTRTYAVCLLRDDANLAAELEGRGLAQDEDVLDTWFSSQLWPFSTLGWPDAMADVDYYYPTSVLITSRDIITLWVVRMVLSGLYNLGRVPFDHVYIHTKILDGRGETMSKSKGNGVDPVDIINLYGADALRYSITEMATETQDVRMPVEYVCPHCEKLTDQAKVVPGGKQPADVKKVKCASCGERFATQWADDASKEELGVARETSDKFEGGARFCNKLYNAARFVFSSIEGVGCEPIDVGNLPPEDRWILARLDQTVRDVHGQLGRYLYAPLIKTLREFFWDDFCDWYIELTKARVAGGPQGVEAKQILAFVLDQILRLMHPVLPFVTEYLWEQLGKLAPKRGLPGVADLAADGLLIKAPFPPADGWSVFRDAKILDVFADLQLATRGVRDLRSKCNVPPKDRVVVTISTRADRIEAISAQAHIVERLAGVSALSVVTDAKRPKNAGSIVVGDMKIFVHDISDDSAEAGRIDKEIADVQRQIDGKRSKLENEKFVSNAKPEVVAAERERLDALQQRLGMLEAHLAELQ